MKLARRWVTRAKAAELLNVFERSVNSAEAVQRKRTADVSGAWQKMPKWCFLGDGDGVCDAL